MHLDELMQPGKIPTTQLTADTRRFVYNLPMARTRIVGTVEEALKIEEISLERDLPASFRLWLLENNGTDLKGTHIYPVRDERDTRKTWESLAYNLKNEWTEGLRKTAQTNLDYSQLLPFADSGRGDYFCFDYSADGEDDEWPVVLWSQETGTIEFYANDFLSFKEKVLNEDTE